MRIGLLRVPAGYRSNCMHVHSHHIRPRDCRGCCLHVVRLRYERQRQVMMWIGSLILYFFRYIASVGFLSDVNLDQRRTLAVYPIFLFYFVIGWMVRGWLDSRNGMHS